MFSNQGNKIISCITIWLGVLFLVMAATPRVTLGANVTALVAKAKEEGALNATITSGFGLTLGQQLGDGLQKPCGLNIKVTLTPIASPQYSPRAACLIRAGAAPTYDAMEGPALSIMALHALGAIEQTADCKRLLTDIKPPVRAR